MHALLKLLRVWHWQWDPSTVKLVFFFVGLITAAGLSLLFPIIAVVIIWGGLLCLVTMFLRQWFREIFRLF